MSEDEAELTHYPGPSRALHSPEHTRARTRSPPPASRRPDTDSNVNGTSNPPMRAAHEQDDASVWWCSFKRRTPQTSTPAITPDGCPLCPPSAKLRMKTVADVINRRRYRVPSDDCVCEGSKYFVSRSCRSSGYAQWIMSPFAVHDQCFIYSCG